MTEANKDFISQSFKLDIYHFAKAMNCVLSKNKEIFIKCKHLLI